MWRGLMLSLMPFGLPFGLPGAASLLVGPACVAPETLLADFEVDAALATTPDAKQTVDATTLPTVRVLGILGEVPDFRPLADVTVSVVDHPEIPSVRTDADGRWILAHVPMNTDIVVRYAKPNYIPQVTRVLAVGNTDFVIDDNGNGVETMPHGMVPRIFADIIGDAAGIPLDWSRGLVQLRFYDPLGNSGLPGRHAALAPLTGLGPVYVDDASGYPDVSLVATTLNGTVVFMNCDPGSGEITLLPKNCTAFGRDAPNPIQVRIFAGTLTNGGMVRCRP